MESSDRSSSKELLTPDESAGTSENNGSHVSVALGEDDKTANGIGEQLDETIVSDSLTVETFTKKAQENQFSIRKRVAQCMVDLALFAANISQLRIILKTGSEHVEFYYLLLTFVSLSLVGQLLFAVLIVIIWERESKMENGETCDSGNEGNPRQRDRVTDYLNCASVIIVFIVTVLNVCISGFGVGIKQTSEPTTVKPAST